MLFRYYSVRWVESLLTRGEVFFPIVASFNDPFDLKARFVFKASVLMRRRIKRTLALEHMRNLARQRGRELDPAERRKILRTPLTQETLRLTEDRFFEARANTVGVLSLAERKDNLLTWAHYADSHRGVCVEFDRSREPLRTAALKVFYSEDYPEVDFFQILERIDEDSDEAIRIRLRFFQSLCLTKSLEWSYEAEWRVIDEFLGGKLQRFPEGIVTAVYLGCRMEEEDEKRILKWISSGPLNPKVFRTTTDPKSFHLNFEEIS